VSGMIRDGSKGGWVGPVPLIFQKRSKNIHNFVKKIKNLYIRPLLIFFLSNKCLIPSVSALLSLKFWLCPWVWCILCWSTLVNTRYDKVAHILRLKLIKLKKLKVPNIIILHFRSMIKLLIAYVNKIKSSEYYNFTFSNRCANVSIYIL
jgi:hypothetical protein